MFYSVFTCLACRFLQNEIAPKSFRDDMFFSQFAISVRAVIARTTVDTSSPRRAPDSGGTILHFKSVQHETSKRSALHSADKDSLLVAQMRKAGGAVEHTHDL